MKKLTVFYILLTSSMQTVFAGEARGFIGLSANISNDGYAIKKKEKYSNNISAYHSYQFLLHSQNDLQNKLKESTNKKEILLNNMQTLIKNNTAELHNNLKENNASQNSALFWSFASNENGIALVDRLFNINNLSSVERKKLLKEVLKESANIKKLENEIMEHVSKIDILNLALSSYDTQSLNEFLNDPIGLATTDGLSFHKYIYLLEKIIGTESANIISSAGKLRKLALLMQEEQKIKSQINTLTQDITNQNANAVAQAEAEILDIEKEIQKLQAQINSLNINIEDYEIYSLKENVNNYNFGGSIMAGYKANLGGFGFITEIGVDLGNNKIGKGEKGELKLEGKYHAYFAQKIGYYIGNSVSKNHLTYITLGLGVKDYSVSYKSAFLNIEEKGTAKTYLFGVGQESMVGKNLSLFIEANHIIMEKPIALEFGEMKVKSDQIKIGFRYYM